MMRFLTTLAVAATTVTVQADRTTNWSVNPVAQWNNCFACAISSIARSESSVSNFGRCIRAAGRHGIPCDPRFDEAKAIWGPTGIAFDWHRITSKDMAVTWHVTVMIDDDRKEFADGEALGLDPVYGPWS